jgi:hypothetical protein
MQTIQISKFITITFPLYNYIGQDIRNNGLMLVLPVTEGQIPIEEATKELISHYAKEELDALYTISRYIHYTAYTNILEKIHNVYAQRVMDYFFPKEYDSSPLKPIEPYGQAHMGLHYVSYLPKTI